MPGVSLCTRTASSGDRIGQTPMSSGIGDYAKALEEAMEELRRRESGSSRSGRRCDLAVKSVDLQLEVIGRRVDRHPWEERRWRVDRAPGKSVPSFSLVISSTRPMASTS
jgi:hypothetical protein